MNDNTAIANKLAALAAKDNVFADGARVISQAGAPPALAAILQEIDDTVLERTLTFAIGDTEVGMSVAGRRLRMILSISGDLPGMNDVLGEMITAEDTEVVTAAGAILIHLCSDAAVVTVRSTPAGAQGGGAQAGISATALSDLWSVTMDAPPAHPMDRFIAANASAMTAHIRLSNGSQTDASGDTSALNDILVGQLHAFRKRHRALYPRQDGPQLISVEGATGKAEMVTIATLDKELCIFASAPSQIAAICAAWATIVAD